MIETNAEYHITMKQAARFERALEELARRGQNGTAMDARLRELQRAAMQSQLDDLRAELAEYEARCSPEPIAKAGISTISSPPLVETSTADRGD